MVLVIFKKSLKTSLASQGLVLKFTSLPSGGFKELVLVVNPGPFGTFAFLNAFFFVGFCAF